MSAPPYSLEAEQAILGVMLLDAIAAGEAVAMLQIEDFYRESHRLIFGAIADLNRAGRPVDVVVVTDRLREVGKLDDAGGATYITGLLGATFSPSMLPTYASMVKRDTARRKLRALAFRLAQACDNGQDLGKLVAGISSELCGLQEGTRSSSVLTRDVGLAFVPLGDLLARPEANVRWLVEERLPTAGLSLLAGKPKAGKSTLARCLALAVARGAPWLNLDTHPGTVLYLALEEKVGEVRAHFEAMGATADDPVFVFCERAPQDALELLRREAEQRRPVLIVIDPLLKLVRVKDGNDYTEMTRALEPLLALARETGAHVLAVHHLGKGDRSGGDAILGSTAIFAAVDTALLLKRSERYRTLSSIQRYGDDLEEVTLALDPERRWITAGPPRAEADEGSMAGAILEYLAAQAAPVDEVAIREVVEGRKAIQVRALRRLVEHDRVIRTGRGRRGDPFLYALPDSGPLVPNISREPSEPEMKTGHEARPVTTISGSRESAVPPAQPEMTGTSNSPAEGRTLVIRWARGWRCTSPSEAVRRAVQLALHRLLPPLARRAAELFDATILEVRYTPARRKRANA